MRTFLKATAVAILLACVFFAGALTAGIRHWFQPVIEISVVNNSGQHISDIEVSLETGGQKSITTLGSLENGQTRTYRFYVAGEGGYILTATLGNGRKVSSDMRYVESGYSIKETIMTVSIKSEIKFFSL
jgi:hypothetical protein